ncbi:hypothetical protein TA3x_001192 [Tundrisphaera sp. TA3]|uniref:hypothetical protein n=1 Tax=Tundrisphaera sp. TA3 TaxID=3435775 RepID=UPI003EBCED5D
MAYSPLGYSLPDLRVSAYAAKTAAWGGPLAIQVRVNNIGASSIVEPTNLAPGSTSSADAPATSVAVFASTRPGAKGKVVNLGSIAIPATPQNSENDVTGQVTLPQRPAGFAANGQIYLTLVVNNDRSILESNFANNVRRIQAPVDISNPLPDLKVVALDIPAALQPGDVITPTIRIGNFGNADPAAQGPVNVILVASLNDTYGPGDAVLGSYTINSLPALSQVPTTSFLSGDENVTPPANYNTTTLAPLQLPTTPGKYFIGVIIDPNDTIQERSETSAALQFLQRVGPRVRGLSAANKLADISVGNVPVFPQLPSAIFNPVTPVTPGGGGSDGGIPILRRVIPVSTLAVSAKSGKARG